MVDADGALPTCAVGEIEGIKKLYYERQRRSMDHDYYKRKVAEMQAKPQRDYQKLQRNAEKLAAAEMAFAAINAEVKARMTALLTERWDFINVRRTTSRGFRTRWHLVCTSKRGRGRKRERASERGREGARGVDGVHLHTSRRRRSCT